MCACAWIYRSEPTPLCSQLMHRHSRDVSANGDWSCRGPYIDCSVLPIIAAKSDQRQTHKGNKTSPNQHRSSAASTPRSNMFNCLWCCAAPTAKSPRGESQVRGLTFPFHSQLHSHVDWEMYPCSSLPHRSNYRTQTKLEALSTGIGTRYPLEAVRQFKHWTERRRKQQ